MAQGLGLHAFSAKDPGSIPDGELRICKLCSAANMCMCVNMCVCVCECVCVCVCVYTCVYRNSISLAYIYNFIF